MVSRETLKARREAEAEERESAFILKGSQAFPYGSVMRTILEQAEGNGGIIKILNAASYDGKGINIRGLIYCLHKMANPTHKENRWSCLVEMVKYDDDAYLRFVPSIPLEVKNKWEATGKPPRQTASNDIGFILEILKKALPAKPVAKETPAKKPAPAIEESPEQKKNARRKKTVDLVLARLSERLKSTNPHNT